MRGRGKRWGERSHWMYTDRGGLLEVLPRPTDRVAGGERVAVLRNAFGDVIREYHARFEELVRRHPAAADGQRMQSVAEQGV